MTVAVLTVDQNGSTRVGDRVPTVLAGLTELEASAGLTVLRDFERTAGDEFQGVLDAPEALPTIVGWLLREGDWNIGIGVGEVDLPLPESTRAGRGPAFVHAREAVTSAKASPWHLRVVGDGPSVRGARALETTLWLWAAVLGRRTPGGWEVADQVDAGSTYAETARRLGITPGAVSQRAQAAGIVESRRARELAVELTAALLT